MPNAVGTNARLGYVLETTPGTTPASALQLVRATELRPGGTVSSTESEELTLGRQGGDQIMTDARGGWSFNYEMSYGNLDGLLESLFGSAWATDVLKVGNTLKTLSTEFQFTDAAQYAIYRRSLVNDFTLNVARGRVIGGSMGAASDFPEWATTSFGTGAATAAPTNGVMDPVASVQLIQEGGSGAVAGPAEFSLHLSNGIIEFPELGSYSPSDLRYGRFKAEGTLNVYFADRTYIDKFLAWTDTELLFTIGGATALNYTFSFPRVKLSVPNITGIAVNRPIVIPMTFSAQYDATDATTASITRDPS